MTTHEVPDGLRVEGFRMRQSFGYGGLSRTGTILAVLVLLFDGLLGTRAPATLLVTIPVTLFVALLAVTRRHGMPLLSYGWARFSWRRAEHSDAAHFRRVLLPHPPALDLPGVGASSSLIKAYDPSAGAHVGVVHNRVRLLISVSPVVLISMPCTFAGRGAEVVTWSKKF